INRATRLFSGLADLDYKPSYNNHTYFQYLSNNKNDISLLGAYHPKEIFDKYIIWVAGKGFIVVIHPSEIYRIPDAHECIDGNLPLCLVLDIDVRQKPDPINSGLSSLDTNKISRFVEKVANRVGKPYSEFIDLGLYKSHFSLRLLGLAKGDRVKRPAISSVKEGYHELEDYLTFSSKKPEKEKFQLIEDETTLSKGASLVTAKYEWLEIGNIRKGFVNFQAQSLEACPICNICHKKDQLYGFLRKLSEMAINIEKLRDAPEAYPDFLNTKKTTILIRSPPGTWKTTALREIIMALKDK
ncbi:4947_t:CDS:2, partial [Gigaspora margarita]